MALFFQQDPSDGSDSWRRESFSDELAALFQVISRPKRDVRLLLLSACRLLLGLSLLAAIIFSAHYWLNAPDARLADTETAIYEHAPAQIANSQASRNPAQVAGLLVMVSGLSAVGCLTASCLTVAARRYVHHRWPAA